MEINITALDYFRELELMEKQYGQEEDLYPWIYMILQMVEQSKKEKVSIRDVHNNKHKKTIPFFFGLAGSPDFAILDEKYFYKSELETLKDDLSLLYGCVEIKGHNEKLFDIKELFLELKEGDLDKNINVHRYQIIGHLLWYGKVLYTNGLKWELLKLDIEQLLEDKICILNNCINNNYNWLKSQKAKELLKCYNFSEFVQIEPIADFAESFRIFFKHDKESEKYTELIRKLEHDNDPTKSNEPREYKEWGNLIENLSGINWE